MENNSPIQKVNKKLLLALLIFSLLFFAILYFLNSRGFKVVSVTPETGSISNIQSFDLVFEFSEQLIDGQINNSNVQIFPELDYSLSIKNNFVTLSVSGFPLVNDTYSVVLSGIQNESGEIANIFETSFSGLMADSVDAFRKTLPITKPTYVVLLLADNTLLVSPIVGFYDSGLLAALGTLETAGVDPAVYKVTISKKESLGDPTGGANPFDFGGE